MAFFQNVFDQEFQGNLLLADRKLTPVFKVGPNKNLQTKQLAWNAGPYDLSGRTNLEFNFAWDSEFRHWASLSIDVSGATESATTPAEVAAALNSDPTFSSTFRAEVTHLPDGDSVIISKVASKRQQVKFYFGNSGAESAIGFNKMAPVAELPEYFERHAIENASNFEDSVGMLVRLDESDPVDQAVIENAGFDPSSMKADWELLQGRSSGLFTFQKLTVDGSDRITQIIEYPAGAKVGDFARKINYVYAGGNANPTQVTEVPHVLRIGDLVSPPSSSSSSSSSSFGSSSSS
jgi:hypothetical protein